MNKVTAVLFFLIIILGVLLFSVDKENKTSKLNPVPLQTFDPSKSPVIDVYVSKALKYEADEFLTMAVLELRGPDKELLFKQLEMRRHSIFDKMKKIDIDEGDIEQNSIDMRKEWSYDKGTRSLTGYVVSQTFAIRSGSRNVAAAVVAVLSAEMDVEIEGTSASLRGKDSLQQNIIRAVGEEALAKAKLYAESVGGSAGRVIAVSDGSNEYENAASRTLTLGGVRSSYSKDYFDGLSVSSIADSVLVAAEVHLTVELLQ